MADGAVVDWPEVERRLATGSQSSTAQNLRFLQGFDGGRGITTSLESGRTLAGTLARLVLALAGLQVLAALLIFVFGPGDSKAISGVLVLTAMAVFAGAAVVLLTAGSRDSRSLSLAGVFLCFSAAMSQRFLPQLSTVLPPAEILVAFLPDAFLPAFFWMFVRDFPRVVRFSRWSRLIQPMLWSSLVIGCFLFTVNAIARLNDLEGPDGPAWVQPFLRRATGIYWGTLAILTLLAPLVSLLRLRSAPGDEKKRVRTFLAGLAIGIAPLFVQLLLETLIPAYFKITSMPRWQALSASILYAFLLTVPVTTTYAVVARRVLDLRLVLNRAARFALARSSLTVLAVAPIVILALRAYRERGLPLAEILATGSARFWLLASLAGGSLLVFRAPLLRWVEHRLLGRAASASSALASFGLNAHRARSSRRLVQEARHAIEELLRCDTVSLLLREADGPWLRDTEGWLEPLTADSSLLRMAEASPGVLLVDREARGSLFPWLPKGEREWIGRADLCLLLPVAATDDSIRGVLGVGRARSGATYSPDERKSLEAFGSSLALALDRLGDGPAPFFDPEPSGREGPAGECGRCQTVSDSASGSCRCGGPLEPAVVPRVLHGKFRTDRVLGRGGMGVVYLATDLALGRPVALKTLPRLEVDALRRLEREARSMASLTHPALATIYGTETWRGVPVLVVEYLPGGALAQRLTAPMAPRAVIELGIELATALEAMHRRGLLHRDLKPSNIGYSEEGKVKLLDFGLARLFEEAGSAPEVEPAKGPPLAGIEDPRLTLTLSRHLVGTPLYLSPEALAGAPAAPAQDLWALFLVLWEALAGSHPLEGQPLPRALERLSRAEIPDIRTKRPGISEALANLLAEGLHRRLVKRPRTANEVRRVLAAVGS